MRHPDIFDLALVKVQSDGVGRKLNVLMLLLLYSRGPYGQNRHFSASRFMA